MLSGRSFRVEPTICFTLPCCNCGTFSQCECATLWQLALRNREYAPRARRQLGRTLCMSMHGLNLIALLVLAEGAAAADVTTLERVAPALLLARSMLKQFNGLSLTQMTLVQ